jgi:hypothetical protein
VLTLVPILLSLFTSPQMPTCPALAVRGYCQSAEVSEPLEYCGRTFRLEAGQSDVSDLVRQEHALAASPSHTARSSFELACARAALRQWEATINTHMIKPRPPLPWHEGALVAALAAARDTPSDTALALLSSLVLRGGAGRPDPGLVKYGYAAPFSPQLLPIATVFRYARDALPLIQHAAFGAATDTALLRACTSIALDLDEFGIAHECAARALSRGYEPSWNLLRLAWFAARRADTSGARNLFTRAIASAGPRSERLAVAWHFKMAIDISPFQAQFWGFITRNTSLRGGVPDAAQTKDEKAGWLDVPQSRLLSWIDQNAGEGNANGWRSLSEPATLVDHFANVAFAGEIFRDCVPHEEAVVCKSKDVRSVHAQRLRFWDAEGNPVAVFTFTAIAHPAHDSLIVAVRQADDHERGRTDTVSVLLTGGGGLVAVPSNDTWDSWTLDIDPRHPAHQVDFQDFQPSTGAPPVILSDLAVGPPTGVATWIYRGAAIPIAATSAFSRAATLQLFYQVRCDSGCGDIERSVALRPVGSTRGHATPLTLTTRGVLRAGINDLTQELDLRLVPAGSYRLEVEIRTEASRSVKRATALIVK